MSEIKYPQVVHAVSETPWAILPTTLAAIREMIQLRAAGERFTVEEIQARIGPATPRRDAQTVGPVAVIPIYGAITPKADMMTDISGGTSVSRLRSTFRDALEDKDVGAIVFDIDSPGGMTSQIPEFAAEVRGARGQKPIYAAANSLAASAAYWLGSQADEFYVTQSGHVGSIGVYALHDDISALQEKMGVKTTVISAGKHKTEGNPWGPLSDEDREAFQERVESVYQMFTRDVAKGRNVSVDIVRGGFGEGRVLTAKKAVEEGMVDGIATLEGVVRGATRPKSAPMAAVSGPNVTVQGALLGTSAPEVTDRIYRELLNTASTTSEAAESGLSFAVEAYALRASAERFVDRISSLAEVKRGRMTAAKRDQVSACTGALRESVSALEQHLADTDPNNRRPELEREFLRYEQQRAHL